MRRSILFMPGNNPGMLLNADILGADGIILDLEDAVSPKEKDAARILVRNAIKYLGYRKSEVIVRINSLDTEFWTKDLDEIIPYKPDERIAHLSLNARCLDSVIDQQFNIIYLVDHDGKGVSFMRNQGIESALRAGSDYITFLDADDTYAPDAYEQIISAISEEPDEPIIQLNHVREFPDGRTQQRMWNRRGTYTLDNLPQLWVSSCNKVIKADLIKDIRFIEGLNHGEDELFILECLAKARRLYHSERIALHYHKDNPNSLSTVTSLYDLLCEQEHLCYFAEEHKDDPELLRAIRQRQAELWNNACYKKCFGGA